MQVQKEMQPYAASRCFSPVCILSCLEGKYERIAYSPLKQEILMI